MLVKNRPFLSCAFDSRFDGVGITVERMVLKRVLENDERAPYEGSKEEQRTQAQ